MKRKLFALVLSVAMAVGLLPISALANGDQVPRDNIEVPVEALYYEATSGGIAIQGIRKDWFREHCADNGKENPAYLSIRIPAQINGSPVVSIGSNAFCTNKANYDENDRYQYIHPSNYKLTAVDFSGADRLERIESQAFLRNDALSGVLTLPSSLKKLGKYAFSSCTALEGIVLPAGLEEIGNSSEGSVFMGCTGLTFVRTAGGDPNAVFELPASLQSIGQYAFKQCFAPSVKTAVRIPASVSYIGAEAFKNNSLGYLPITTIIVERQDASGYIGDAFEANGSNDYGLGKRMTVFSNAASFQTFTPSGLSTYKNSLTYEFTLQYGVPAVRTEQKLYNQTVQCEKDPSTGTWDINTQYTLPDVPADGVPAGYTGGWAYQGTLLTLNTKLTPKEDIMVVEVENVLQMPTVVPIVDGNQQAFTDTSYDIVVSNDKEHQVGVRVTHPLMETADENGGTVYFKYEWTDVWQGGKQGPRMEEDGFGFPSFPSRGTPTIPIRGAKDERTHAGSYSEEDYGDGYYLLEIYGYYSVPGKAAKLFYKSKSTAIAADPEATVDTAYLFYVQTSDPAVPPEVVLEDAEAEYGYSEQTLSASVKEQAGCSYSYQWYEAAQIGQTENGQKIEGANTARLSVQPGKSVGSYPYYLVVTAVKKDNGDTASISVPVTFTVQPKQIMICPQAGQRKYTGQKDPVLSYTAVNAPAGAAITGALKRTEGETPGTYAYSLGSLAIDDDNYQLVLSPEAPLFTIEAYRAVASFTPEVPNGRDGWYTSEVTVTLPAGHLISLDGEQWLAGPVVLGEYQGEFTYYLKSIRDDDTKDAVAVNTTSLYIDTVPPLIAGLEEGGVYCLKASFAVSEKNLAQVLVDGVPQTLAQQSYTLMPGSHTVKAVDLAGNSAIVHVTVNAQHTPGGMIVDAPPTCTGPGSGHTDCTVCGQTAQTGLIIAAPGHTFGPWTVTKQATNVQSGRKERVCTVCGYKETAKIPAFADPASPSAPGSDVPRTGDSMAVWLWALGMLSAAGGILGIGMYQRKKDS